MKTFPFVSQAMQVGVAEGRANKIGPVMSEAASADTQLSSSSVVEAFGSIVVRAFLEFGSWLVSGLGCLRFLDFLSPLNARGLTMTLNRAYNLYTTCSRDNSKSDVFWHLVLDRLRMR